jgi:hypothetical protein
VVSSDTTAQGLFAPVMLTACVNKFAFYKTVKGFKEILAYPFAVMEFNKFLNCGYIDVFLAHMRDVKEQKLEFHSPKRVSNFPCNFISGSGLRAIQHYAGRDEQS